MPNLGLFVLPIGHVNTTAKSSIIASLDVIFIRPPSRKDCNPNTFHIFALCGMSTNNDQEDAVASGAEPADSTGEYESYPPDNHGDGGGGVSAENAEAPNPPSEYRGGVAHPPYHHSYHHTDYPPHLSTRSYSYEEDYYRNHYQPPPQSYHYSSGSFEHEGRPHPHYPHSYEREAMGRRGGPYVSNHYEHEYPPPYHPQYGPLEPVESHHEPPINESAAHEYHRDSHHPPPPRHYDTHYQYTRREVQRPLPLPTVAARTALPPPPMHRSAYSHEEGDRRDYFRQYPEERLLAENRSSVEKGVSRTPDPTKDAPSNPAASASCTASFNDKTTAAATAFKSSTETNPPANYPAPTIPSRPSVPVAQRSSIVLQAATARLKAHHYTDNSSVTCTCKKSKCLKLYCHCFSANSMCSSFCRCTECMNTTEAGTVREDAVKATLQRNPNAFRSKFVKVTGGEEFAKEWEKNERAKQMQLLNVGDSPAKTKTTGVEMAAVAIANPTHKLGCNCRKSFCLKRYCECFGAQTPCGLNCKCLGCQNQPE